MQGEPLFHVMAHVERLHVTLLCRFVYDCMHLANVIVPPPTASKPQAAPASALNQVAASTASAAALGVGEGAGTGGPDGVRPGSMPRARGGGPLVRWEMRDLRLDLPRRSEGCDFLSLAVAAVEVSTPASRAHLAAWAPNMDECAPSPATRPSSPYKSCTRFFVGIPGCMHMSHGNSGAFCF